MSHYHTVEIADLRLNEQRDYLRRLMEENTAYHKPPSKQRIALRVEYDTGLFAFIKDAYVNLADRKKFSAEAPPGLWLSGATGALRTRDGILAVYDDRLRGFKPVPMGWADFEDGPDLLATVRRECAEEVIVFSMDREYQYVPGGVSAAPGVPCLAINSLDKLKVWGDFRFLRYNTKTANGERVLVAHFGWELRGLPEKITVVYDDKWHQGGYFGAPVVVLDPGNGHMVGYYSGQQGFVRLDACSLDEDLALILRTTA